MDKLTKYTETIASIGLLVVAFALVMPILRLTGDHALSTYKWVYAAGALVYTIAKMIGATDKSGSKRLRRLRRIEFWAGVAFMFAAAFWFYQEEHLGIFAGPLAILQPVISLSLAGALIQIIASWLIARELKKEQNP